MYHMHPLLVHELGLVSLLTGIMLFAHWFAYLTGVPLGEPSRVDPGAILFFVPYYLAKRRMRGNLFDRAVEAWREELSMTGDTIGAVEALRHHRHNVVVQARPLFTWERGLLCPVCLHWWLSFWAGWTWLVAQHFHTPPLDLAVGALTYLFLHFIIRKI